MEKVYIIKEYGGLYHVYSNYKEFSKHLLDYFVQSYRYVAECLNEIYYVIKNENKFFRALIDWHIGHTESIGDVIIFTAYMESRTMKKNELKKLKKILRRNRKLRRAYQKEQKHLKNSKI